MATTISNTLSTGVSFGTNGITSPLTITTTGEIDAGTAIAVYASPTYLNADVVNYGSVIGYETGHGALSLGDGGSVTNSGTGSQIKGDNGIVISGAAGTVSNFGTVDATAGRGVALDLGGSIENTAGYIQGSSNSVEITGATGTVTNTGTIKGGGSGVQLDHGGSVSNTLGTITGVAADGVSIAGGTGTVVNTGSLLSSAVFRYNAGAYLAAGGSVANTGGQIQGYIGVYIVGAAGTVTNSGTINASGNGALYHRSAGVRLTNSGSVDNTSGQIDGARGIYIIGTAATVTNAGMITGTAGAGIEVRDGGTTAIPGATITNTGGTIRGTNYGIAVRSLVGGVPATVSNTGTITGANLSGIYLGDGGSIDNTGGYIRGLYSGIGDNGSSTVTNTGKIIANKAGGGTGVYLGTNSTLTNSGTIGSQGRAVYFRPGSGNVLNIDPGAVFYGTIDGGNTLGAVELSTLDFATGSGSLGSFGTSVVNFGSIIFSPGASWSMSGTASVLAQEDITGFHNGDQIDVAAIGTTGVSASVTGSVVNLLDGGGATLFTFNDLLGPNGGALNPATLKVFGDGAGGSIIACFATDTNIATPSGPVPVERLAIGDPVITQSGRAMPIKWIGRRSYTAQTVRDNPQLRPVRITAGALAPATPSRDLLVSPLHGMLVHGVLVAAGALVNGHTIRREPPSAITYLHVELDHHAMLLAEGAPAESFCDQHSRAMFANAAEFASLYPDAKLQPPRYRRADHGPDFERVRAHFAPPRTSRGMLLGHVERIGGGIIEGWTMDAADPLARVALRITADNMAPLLLTAAHYRTDLDKAGLADGCCGFRAALPSDARGVQVSRASDGALLPISVALAA